MTLIAQIHDPQDGFFAIADTMITYLHAHDGNPDMLPLQVGLNLGFGTLATRLASKAVLFGNYIVLWAGPVSAAREIIELFMDIGEPTHADFKRIIDENLDLANKLNLIYACFDGEKVWSGDWRCGRRDLKNLSCHAGGSGADSFLDFDGIAPIGDCFHQADHISAAALGFNRLGGMIFRELSEYMHQHEEFGGAYEMFTNKPEGGFERLSYSIAEISSKRHIEGDYVDYASQSRTVLALGSARGTLLHTTVGDGLDDNQIMQHAYWVEQILTKEDLPKVPRDAVFLAKQANPIKTSFCYILGTRFDWNLTFDRPLHHLEFAKDGKSFSVVPDSDQLDAIIYGFYRRGHSLLKSAPT